MEVVKVGSSHAECKRERTAGQSSTVEQTMASEERVRMEHRSGVTLPLSKQQSRFNIISHRRTLISNTIHPTGGGGS